MSVRFTGEDLSRIEATMQALLSPLASPDVDSWRDLVLERLTDLLAADRALFGMAMPGIDSPHRLFGATESELEPYLIHYCYVDPTRTLIPRVEDGIVSGTLLQRALPGGRAGYHRTEVYTDYYRPLGVEDHVSILVEPALKPRTRVLLGASVVLSAYSSRWGTELFGDKGLAIMRLLRPALLAGVEALDALSRHRTSLERTVDLIRDAALLCSANGDALHQNRAMTDLLISDPERERIDGALRVAARTLAWLARNRREHGREVALSPQLDTIRTQRATYRVRGSLLEVRPGTREPGMIIVLERFGADDVAPEVLQERFGLTRREALVALLLVQRRRNSEIAEVLSISPNTARRHTDSVLLKLGVHSRDAVPDAILRGLGGADPDATSATRSGNASDSH
jgi:DNA-binding CsgD family transcriptional regulator